MDFKDRVAVITGGSSGIGKAIAVDLAKEGATVILIARNKDKLKVTLEEIKKYSPNSIAASCDVTDTKKVANLVKVVNENFNAIDILINSAGFGLNGSFIENNIQGIRDQIEVNFFGTVNFCKEVSEVMVKQHSGYIVNISSVAGRVGFPNLSGYCASKFAVYGFSEVLYHELKPHNIKVSIVLPIATETNFFNNPSWDSFPHEERHKNILKPEEVSKAVLIGMKKENFEIVVPSKYKLKLIGKAILLPWALKYIQKLPK
ncbi:SDR family NAD(P)-dependent oxidoreductase [Candidatus Woesearchaeota archaeon]|nr:SDR family NAD(P)-dependent oxidoreductase [Candidatus Woesearchaeota archaeon]